MGGDKEGKVAGSTIGDIQGTLMLPLVERVKSGVGICREGTSSVVFEALSGASAISVQKGLCSDWLRFMECGWRVLLFFLSLLYPLVRVRGVSETLLLDGSATYEKPPFIMVFYTFPDVIMMMENES